ncbi:MAG TPA: urate hydroxylase PuuD [Casimicrobiaceae bacterium]
MEAYVVDWLSMLVRWLHLVAGIAWIGASFYFVMLDNSLMPPQNEEDRKHGVFGELWAVHGGGFYNSRKYLTGPKGEPLSEHLHWSKWEAYTTWMSGVGLLAIVYWHGASTFLIDTSVMDLTPAAAIAISIGFLVGGWLVYDALCRILEGREMLLGLVLFVLIVIADWGLFHLFSARAAYIHVGAMIGTMMVANVFLHIIPGQKRMVAAIRAGSEPDPRPGVIGKQRSVHNTYFTLPVLFIMISNHYPMTYGTPQGWLVLAAIMLAGVLIRQFFVLRHRGRVNYALPAASAVILAAVAIAIAPQPAPARASVGDAKVTFSEVRPIIAERCAVCHSEKPTQPGFAAPPAGVLLDSAEHIRDNAPRIEQQAVATQTMPLANITKMTPDERALIGRWIAEGAKTR